jgi:hypothetical protein
MFLGAALMAGWTGLLVWGSRRPVERKAVLLLTVWPVVIGLAAAGVYAVSVGFIPISRMVPTWVAQAVLAGAMTHAYRATPTPPTRRA